MRLETLRDLYMDALQDLYSAQTQLVEALPSVVEAVPDPQLRNAFEILIQEARQHALRLKQLLEGAGFGPGRRHCEGVAGILKEAAELLRRDAEPDVRAAGLIATVQKVEHYQIAGYGAARTYAEVLGENEAAQLLQEALNEARQTDEKLNQIAHTGINLEAAHGPHGQARRAGNY